MALSTETYDSIDASTIDERGHWITVSSRKEKNSERNDIFTSASPMVNV
jgi:hypothetical protein